MGCTTGSLCHGAAVAVEVALGISGRIGSGKTSLAVVLAERLNCPAEASEITSELSQPIGDSTAACGRSCRRLGMT